MGDKLESEGLRGKQDSVSLAATNTPTDDLDVLRPLSPASPKKSFTHRLHRSSGNSNIGEGHPPCRPHRYHSRCNICVLDNRRA